MKKTLLLFLIIFFSKSVLFSQGNCTDWQGKDGLVPCSRLGDIASKRYSIYIAKDSTKNGFAKHYYSNGNLHYMGEYKDNKPEGTWTFYHNDGKLNRITNFLNGYADGKEEIYSLDGNICQIINYKNGLTHGEYKFIHPDGKITIENRSEGELHGLCMEYYPNGQLKRQSNYNKGSLDGAYEEYYESGKIKEAGIYVSGIKIKEYNIFFEDGSLSEKQIYTESVPADIDRYSSVNSDIKGGRLNGFPVGEWRGFHSNGQHGI